MTTDIYQDLVTRLKSFDTAFEALAYSKIVHYDLFKNQYHALDVKNPFNKPAIFFEFSFEFTDNGQLSQQGTGTLRVHVVQEDYANSADGSSNQQQALERLLFIDLINECLHGYSGTSFNKLMRRRFAPDIDPSDLIVNIIEYTFNVMDDSTHRLKDYVLTVQGQTTLTTTTQLVQDIPKPSPASKYTLPPQ